MLSLASTSALKELISQRYSDRGPLKMQEITIGSFKGKAAFHGTLELCTRSRSGPCAAEIIIGDLETGEGGSRNCY